MSALAEVSVTIAGYDDIGRVPAVALLLAPCPIALQLADRLYLRIPVDDASGIEVGKLVAVPDSSGEPAEVFEVLSTEPDQSDENLTRLHVKPARDKTSPFGEAKIRHDALRETSRAYENEENRRKAQVQKDAMARLRGAGFGRLASKLVSFAPHWDDRFAEARSSLFGALESDVAEADRQSDAEAA